MALFRQEGEGVPARKAAPIPCGKANMRDIEPNPHKALGVKRKSFPRPRGSAFSLTPFSPGCSSGGEAIPRRPGLPSAADATPGPAGRGRAAPNTHADSGGPAPQSRAAVPGTASRPVPIRIRSRLRGHSTIGGLTSAKGGASLARLTGGAGRPAMPSCSGALRRGSGGPWDGASAPSPYSRRQPRADPVSSPDPPPERAPVIGHRGSVSDGRGRRPIRPAGCRGCGRGHTGADS
jgi:hypothetical protein